MAIENTRAFGFAEPSEVAMAAELSPNEMPLDSLNQILHDLDEEIQYKVNKRYEVIQAIRNKLDNAQKLMMISDERYHKTFNQPMDDRPMPMNHSRDY